MADRDDRTRGFEDKATRMDSTRPVPLDDRETAADHQAVQARVEAAVAATEGKTGSSVDPMLGRLVSGRFQVLARVGAGGMGIVYKARQTGMDRFVAVKVLLRELAHDEKVVKRFKIEALAVSRLTHPNTIRIYDFGQTEDDILYFAMEYLEGRSLELALRQDGPMSAARTLHIMKQIAQSLQEAHDKGIVHRDLKPDNIYLTQVGGDRDFVKVLDFGVAKLREADKRQGTVTQAGTIFGTPRYMAPEQCRSQGVDHRADLYALGVIAYEMMTGKAPFDAESPLSILIQHVQEAPPPLAVMRPDIQVPDDVEAMVMRCLEKSADQRFQSANALIQELARLEAEVAGRYQQVVFVTGPRAAPPRAGAGDSRAVASTVHGARADEAKPASRRRMLPWAIGAVLAIGVTAVALAGAGVFSPSAEEPVGALTAAAPSPAAAPVPTAVPVGPAVATPARVNVSFRSDPEGAEVFEGDRPIGRTPFRQEYEAGAGAKEYLFRLAGYKDAAARSSLKENETLAVALTKAPVHAVRTTGATVAGPSTGPAATTPTPPVGPAPGPEKKKDDGPSKVGDLKKSPY